MAHHRLTLSQKQGRRVATLTKSSEKQQAEVYFAITSDGINDDETSLSSYDEEKFSKTTSINRQT